MPYEYARDRKRLTITTSGMVTLQEMLSVLEHHGSNQSNQTPRLPVRNWSKP
jgi:hypothetical protein